MSEPGWTPPWKPERWTQERWGTWDADAIKSADGHVIAMVVRHEPGVPDEQLTGNAHLLAASPELNEALRPFGEVGKEILASRERIRRGEGSSSFSLPGEWVEWCVTAVAALAKARGESQ